jgi:hypothetical protein
VSGVSTITMGGTLIVTNLSGTFAANDTFKLFNAGTYQGSFASVQIHPASPGAGLTWDTSQLAGAGILRVSGQQAGQITEITYDGSNVQIAGTNGTPGASFRVLSSINVAAPLSAWQPVSTNAFNAGGGFTVTIPVNPAEPQRFYLIAAP